MKKIHHLSPLLISKIAAGEVIERPSFAVKELIENAIDANASEIKIYIEDAGLRKIQIVDNGEGMSEEDTLESWKPHTTSKLRDESELHNIKSLGFRGEALASLSAVSRLTIRSRVNPSVMLGSLKNESKIKKGSWVNQSDNAVGLEIVVVRGKLQSSSPVGMAPGTLVVVENLFADVPARKKFLKSSQTELRHIIDIVNHFAVSYPDIKFSLTHGKRTLLEYPITKNISERVEQLVGKDVFSFFIPLKKSDSYVSLKGFIAKPQINSSTQSKQFLFVNSRKVTDKVISQAVKEAFGTMLEGTSYPVFVLFLEVPFEMVDVNVHPRKEQVSFVNNQFMYQTIKSLITELLEEHNLTFQNLSWKRQGVGMTKSYAGELLKANILDKEKWEIDETTQIIQLHKLYIIVPAVQGLILVDQHAAHERILFEKLSNEFVKQKKMSLSFQLPKPVQIPLTKSDMVLLEEHKKLLEDVGFLFVISNTARNLETISSHDTRRDDMLITHIPALFQDRNPQELVKTILDDLDAEKGVREVDKMSEEMLAFLACRAAVKAGDKLTEKQMKKILDELEDTPHNTTCPHGRPTRIEFPFEEINNLFKR